MKIELKKLIDASKALDSKEVHNLVTALLERNVVLKDNWLGVSRVCMSVGKYRLAKQSAERLVGECTNLTTVLQGIGILSDCGDTSKAYEIVASMLAQNPSLAPIQHTKGVLAYQMGELEESKILFSKVVEKLPLAGEAWHMLSTLADSEEENLRLQNKLESIKSEAMKLPNSPAKATYFNALANVIAHTKGDDAAFDSYEACAKVMETIVPSNSLPFTSLDAFNSAVSGLPSNEKKGNSITPIFVLGLPRSGTTLLSQLLSVHPEITSVGEADTFSLACDLVLKQRRSLEHLGPLSAITELQISEIASTYRALCEELGGEGPFVVDKSLNNLQYVTLLQKVFPDALFIHTDRDSEANAWSIFKTFFSKGMEWTWNASSIAQVVKEAQSYSRECTENHSRNVFRIRINDLSLAPQDELTPILTALGLTYKDNHKEFYLQKGVVQTASMSQIRRPLTPKISEKHTIPNDFLTKFKDH